MRHLGGLTKTLAWKNYWRKIVGNLRDEDLMEDVLSRVIDDIGGEPSDLRALAYCPVDLAVVDLKFISEKRLLNEGGANLTLAAWLRTLAEVLREYHADDLKRARLWPEFATTVALDFKVLRQMGFLSSESSLSSQLHLTEVKAALLGSTLATFIPCERGACMARVELVDLHSFNDFTWSTVVVYLCSNTHLHPWALYHGSPLFGDQDVITSGGSTFHMQIFSRHPLRTVGDIEEVVSGVISCRYENRMARVKSSCAGQGMQDR